MSKPWLKQAGECYDRNGIPIYPGDLLRTFHFRGGPHGRNYYLYHVVVMDVEAGGLRMVPAEYLDPGNSRDGGNPLLTDDLAADAEVIAGCHQGLALSFDERPRRTP